jgi:aminopeptidase
MVPPMLPEYPEATRRELARNLLQHALRVKRGDNLLIETWSATLPWAESMVLEGRMLGARPMLVLEDEPTYWKSIDEAPAGNLGHTGTHDWAALKASNAHVYFYGPLDTTREDARAASITQRINADDHEWFRLVSKYGVRSVRWDLGRTSEVWARRYGVDLERWRRELIEGALLDPRTMQAEGQRVASALRRGRELRISNANGTDLTLRLKGRLPRVDDGVVDDADVRAGNVVTVAPSGVTHVAVDESAGDGTFVSNSTGVMMSQMEETPLRGGTWTFERGRLTQYSFAAGEASFRRAYSKLGEGKDRPGYLSIGLNPKISQIPLLFDQSRGTVTLALGRNSHVGGSTRTPRFTAFQSITKATLEVDGRLVVDHGEIV